MTVPNWNPRPSPQPLSRGEGGFMPFSVRCLPPRRGLREKGEDEARADAIGLA